MNPFFFAPAPEPEGPEGHPDECSCKPADSQYLLTIEEGASVLIHAACGKQPPGTWGDWGDLVTMDQIPVTLEWTPECNGTMWHGYIQCDHGSYIQLTPKEPT